MSEVLDISEVAKGVFSRAKEILQHEGSLCPVRLVLNASGQLKDVQEDRQRTQNAAAVAFFTVCETNYQAFEPLRLPPGESGKMPEGWINDSQPHDCLDMRIEVPGEGPTCIVIPFQRCPDGTIEFGQQLEGLEEFKGPLPPSCDGNKGPVN
ncbi:MAG: hypothetical protein ABSH52_34600 [Terriglobia bacterium]|jgi:hypothetical protein